MNLLNGKENLTNSYFCTWVSQIQGRTVQEQKNDKPQGRDMLDEKFVFGENGLANLLPQVRSKLLFVFDDGWDVGYNLHMARNRDMFGSLEVNTTRFPSCTGTPIERLKKLNQMVLNAGWKGTGVWVCSNAKGEKDGNMLSKENSELYWSERLRWSQEAGIKYWKVDWGHYEKDTDFRKMLYSLGKAIAPDVVIEQAGCSLPLSGVSCDGVETGRFMDWGNEPEHWKKVFSFSDVFRTYDVSANLSAPATIDRVYYLLKSAGAKNTVNGILNVEDELYLGAVLGCNLGIMRSKVCSPANTKFSDPNLFHKKIDEVIRAVNWQTFFSAPYGAEESKIYASEKILFDEHDFSDGSAWCDLYKNKILRQGAPAIVSRNIELPEVFSDGLVPYVLAGKNPRSGSVAIATLARKVSSYDFKTPKVDISLNVGDVNTPVGIFGYYKSLTLVFNDSPKGRIFIQDLAHDTAYDITNEVAVKNNALIINGNVIEKYGLCHVSCNDISEPGAVLRVID